MNIGTLEKLSQKLKDKNQVIIIRHSVHGNNDVQIVHTRPVTLLLIAEIIDEVITEELDRLDKTRFHE